MRNTKNREQANETKTDRRMNAEPEDTQIELGDAELLSYSSTR